MFDTLEMSLTVLEQLAPVETKIPPAPQSSPTRSAAWSNRSRSKIHSNHHLRFLGEGACRSQP
jgi:hypothetical protein